MYGPTSGLEILLNFICAVLPVPPLLLHSPAPLSLSDPRLCPHSTGTSTAFLSFIPFSLPPSFYAAFLFSFIFDTSSLLSRGQPRKRRRVFPPFPSNPFHGLERKKEKKMTRRCLSKEDGGISFRVFGNFSSFFFSLFLSRERERERDRSRSWRDFIENRYNSRTKVAECRGLKS